MSEAEDELQRLIRETQDDAAKEKNSQELRKDEARAKYKGMKLNDLLAQQRDLKTKKEALEADLKRVNDFFDVIRIELVPQMMEDAGIKSPYNVEGIGRVTLTGDMYVQTLDPGGLKAWLRARKFGSLIQETINGSTLKAFLKGRITGAKDLPPDTIVKVDPFTRASITPHKAK